ncbi:S8 family serine peptidase [Thermus oshimai]|uniref:S8 family serine peptidase n=1 Tax=Thermus oshimai TaxID=56957 RepID=UPI0003805148|nr:S8 family serine peptidase [Thermus oshimai]
MKRLAFAGLFLGTALLLTACPNESPPPPPPSTSCTPTPTGLSVQSLGSQQQTPQGLGDFSAPHVPGELLVLPGGLTPQGLAARVEGVRPLSALEGGFLRVGVPKGQERAKAEALLRAGARFVQPNYLYFPLYVPNDPLYPASPADPARLQPYLVLIHMQAAWDLVRVASYGCTPIVAVLDTAFNPAHEDAGLFLSGYNATDDGLGASNLDPSPPPPNSAYANSDPDHGQGVAGLVAAAADNGKGVPGLGLGRVAVLPVKVFYWVNGGYTTTSTTLAKAIRYAADRGAALINLSLGSATPLDGVVQDALNYALSKGSLPVAAAGNNGTDGLMYPAAYPGVLAVGSARLDGARSDFSNYSSTPKDLVLAPGGNRTPAQAFYVLALGQDYSYYESSRPYTTGAGTSFAAPMVSTVAALYVAHYHAVYGRTPTVGQVKQCLIQTASNGGSYNAQTGYGLLRADRVLSDRTYCFP